MTLPAYLWVARRSAVRLEKTLWEEVSSRIQDGLAAMKEGWLKVTVFQNAKGQGEGAVDTALKLAKGDKVDSMVWVPFELVTPDNMDKYASKN